MFLSTALALAALASSGNGAASMAAAPTPAVNMSLSTTCCDPTEPSCDSASKNSPWCEKTKTLTARAALLAAALTVDEQLDIWAFSGLTQPIPRLNLKGSSSKGSHGRWSRSDLRRRLGPSRSRCLISDCP
jgi:hypothetical protein